EPDRHDSESLGRGQQPLARPLARRAVLELGLIEAGERVTDMGLVVDGQAPLPLRVYVGKRRTRQASACFSAELRHPSLIVSEAAWDTTGDLEEMEMPAGS